MTARSKAGFNDDKTLQLVFFDGEEAFVDWTATGIMIFTFTYL
jgi:hypothetical protein